MSAVTKYRKVASQKDTPLLTLSVWETCLRFMYFSAT